MNTYHTSVLLQEAVDALRVQTGEKYIDGTLGGGGHTKLILERGGLVLGIDQDEEALQFVATELPEYITNGQLKLCKGNFRDLDDLIKQENFGNVSGILLDIGISSHHVERAERGFSFLNDGPLDMRMDKGVSVTAKDLVNSLTKQELFALFTRLGEERFSRSIVAEIIEARKKKQIETTTELAEIVKKAVPFNKKGMHPATKVFQALRIAVNDELRSLQNVLPQAVNILHAHGRIVVITFHSLEDRIVKQMFQEFENKELGSIITKKPMIPSEAEIMKNTRARSAKLRIWEKK